jgi:hypothetical protein
MKSDFLWRTFGIKATPSKATLSRILNMINGAEVATVIVEIMKEKSAEIGDVIAAMLSL